jgi:LuxR family maltose regulon positive regulatory protein
MSTPILVTKLDIPPPRPKIVLRPRLIERLKEGLHHKLTLISAPAGFDKTTLIGEWVASCERQVAWLSLDEGDKDTTRFLAYLVAALQTISANLGAGVLAALQSPNGPGMVCVGIGCVRVALCLAGRQVVCKQPGSLIGRENKGD